MKKAVPYRPETFIMTPERGRRSRHLRWQRPARLTKGKYWLIALLFAVCSCGQFEEHAWKSHKKPPRISFDHARYELGEVREGEAVEHAFPFRNLGELDLTIDRTRSTVDCVATLPAGRTVRAKTSGVLQVALDTSGQAGELRRTITVYTNDPRKRTVLLTLAGTVVADVVVDPKQLYVGPVTRGLLASKTFTATVRNESIRVGAASEENPYVTLRTKISPDGTNDLALEIQVAGDAPFGPFDQIVRVPTSSPHQPALRLRVAGIVRPNVTASPDRLTFGDVPRNGAAVRQLLVRNRGHHPVRVTTAEWAPRFGSVEIDTLREGRRYRIRATLGNDVAAGNITSAIRLTTDDPEQPQIEIPVEGRVVEAESMADPRRSTVD